MQSFSISDPSFRQPYSFVNSEVAIAASNCLLARGEEMERLHPGKIHIQEQVCPCIIHFTLIS